MNKVKMIKISVEDVYTESMNSIQSYRYSPSECTPVFNDPDYKMIVNKQIRSRVVPITRYFEQNNYLRTETLVTIDLNNAEKWLPIIKGQLKIADNILSEEVRLLEIENDRQSRYIVNLKSKVDIQEKIINSYANMSIFEKIKSLMVHKLF